MESSARTLPVTTTPVDHNSVTILGDRPFYLPGQKLQGQVRLDLKKQTEIQSLAVVLQGVEKTHSFVYGKGPSAGSFNSSRAMANIGYWLSQRATIPAGSTLFPFIFDIPPDALPSYTGKNANITWKISTKATIGWGKDLEMESLVIIAHASTSLPEPLAVENQETQPRIRLSLPSNVYVPGATLDGRLTLLDPGNMRAVRLQLLMTEYATAQGTYQTRDTTETIPVGDPLEFKRDDLITAREVQFQIPLAAQLPYSYIGTYSRVIWSLNGTLDIPHGKDIHLNLPFQVGLSKLPAATTPPAGPAPTITEPIAQ